MKTISKKKLVLSVDKKIGLNEIKYMHSRRIIDR